MEIKIQSVKFDADAKLIAFIEKKLSRVSKFSEDIISVDVTLTLLPDHSNKCAKVRIKVPGDEVIVEKHADTFEDAITTCADVAKEKLTRIKEKKNI